MRWPLCRNFSCVDGERIESDSTFAGEQSCTRRDASFWPVGRWVGRRLIGRARPDVLGSGRGRRIDAGKDTILVVVQLTGGNDGLNTVVPYNHDEYRKARPKLAIPASDVLKINDTVGLHPSARGLSDLLEAGKLAIVQGVGYPNPNRSHFESMDVWHTCQRKGNPRSTGWLGRFLDASRKTADVDAPAVHIGI